MVSGRLSGWGTARSTSYRRLEGSGCDRECAPKSTCTFPPALGVGCTSEPRPHPAQTSSRALCRASLPGHSRVLQAVRCAQHPLLGHQEAAAHVLAVHLHRRHVGPRVGHGLAAAQDPPTGLRRWGWAGGQERFRDDPS